MALKRLPSFFTFLGQNHFSLLFFSLLVTLGGSMVLAELGLFWFQRLLILLNLLVLLSIVTGRWILRAGLALFALSLITTALSTVSELKAFLPGSQISAVVLLVLGTLACFRALFSPGPVDKERIFASLGLYLLFGLIFALIFAVIEELLPGSFHYSHTLSPDTGTRSLTELFYFSFVTLATLGYGDIVPLSGPAKGMAILEAVIGQMYLVVVVARLVSLYGRSESK
jgi:voltage-gated potassium channel